MSVTIVDGDADETNHFALLFLRCRTQYNFSYDQWQGRQGACAKNRENPMLFFESVQIGKLMGYFRSGYSCKFQSWENALHFTSSVLIVIK